MAIQNDNTILRKGDLKAYHDRIVPYLANNLMVRTNVSDYYSTDEKIVGVWTDGKPIYQKTLTLSKPTSVNNWYTTNIGASVDTIVKLEGMRMDSNAYYYPLTTNRYSSNSGLIFYAQNNSASQPNVIAMYPTSADWVGGTSYIATIQYTKTTDTAGSAVATPGAYDINFPNTWPENQEIYFGNGVYGHRATGNYTAAISAGSNTWTMVADKSTGLTTNKPILSYGGNLEVYSSSGISNTPACVPRAGNFNSCIYIANAGTFRIQAISPSGSSMSIRTTDKYDVWITYIK